VIASRFEWQFCIQGLRRSTVLLGTEVHWARAQYPHLYASKKMFTGLLLTQEKHAADLLTKVGLNFFTMCPTPLSTMDKLSLTDGSPLGLEYTYRIIVGALQHLTLTRPHMSF
jgi:hypothetical protein